MAGEWDDRQCADHAVIAASTWRTMVTRGQAPVPLDHYRSTEETTMASDTTMIARAAKLTWLASYPGGEDMTDVQSEALALAEQEGWIERHAAALSWHATEEGRAMMHLRHNLAASDVGPLGWAWGVVPPGSGDH